MRASSQHSAGLAAAQELYGDSLTLQQVGT
jgi:hypothetical protein